VRLKIANGDLQLGSLACRGYASKARPEFESMRRVE
jgi:hypothetical protein